MNRAQQPDRWAALFDGPCSRILQATSDALLMVDEAQQVVALNPAAQRMFGCSAAEALGQPLARFIPARWRDSHAAQAQSYMASGAVQHAMARRRRVAALRADGQEFAVEVHLSRVAIAGADGPRHYVAALLRDLGDEQARIDELEMLKRRLLALFELAPIAIWITEDEHIVFANRAAASLLEVESGTALVGRSIYDLLHPPSHAALREQLVRVLGGDAASQVIGGRVQRGNGEWRELEIVLAALPDHGRTTVQMVLTDITQRRREGAELERSRRALRELSASVVEAREEERRRIARELHDELGQRLTALKMDLASLAGAAEPRTRDASIRGMLSMLDETVASVRRISADLRPMMLDDLGLNAAIEWLARDATRRMGTEVTVRLDETDPPVDERTCTAVYRMVQEALTNVARHAQATDVRVELHRHGDALVLTVQDNGIGFSTDALEREGSFGLLGLRERALMLGGRMEVGNVPGSGGRVTVTLPLHHARERRRRRDDE
jgi:two-component system, NarL family, sensor histidine kinase UhpB